MDKRFEAVDKRFEQVDKRFEQVDKRFEQVDKRFEQIEKCFVPKHIAEWAQGFSSARFLENFKRVVGPILEEKGLSQPW